MTRQLSLGARLVSGVFALFGALLLTSSQAVAATYYWDSDGNATGDNPVLGTNLGGTGTWDTSSLLWYSSITNTDIAWPNLTTDTSVFIGPAGMVTIAAGGVGTGSLQFLTTGYTLGGGQLTLGGASSNIFVGSAVTATISAAIAGSNGLGLYGPGTLVLTGLSNYSGNTSISNGATLNLNFSTNTTNLINNGSPLVLNGGALTLTGTSGATDSQTFAGTSVTGGGIVTLTQGGATSLTAALGAITQTSGGSLNFSVIPLTSGVIATTSNTNVSGILGPWATVGSGTTLSYATVNGSNQIVAYTGGTAAATGAALTDTTGTVNYNLAAAAGTVPATFSANTIRYTGAAATTAPGATGFTVNGLINSGTGLWTIGTNAITIGANKELEIITGTNGITITSVIKDNGGGASSLTYSGTGALTLSKANSYSGTTTVNSGTLNLGIAAALNSASSLVINGGTFGEVTFADTVASVSLRNGSITGTTGILTSIAAWDLQNGTVGTQLAGTVGLNKTTPGTVTLSPVTTGGTLTGNINIKAGTLIMGGTAVVSFAAADIITLGDSSGSADARLAVQNTLATYANPIVLSSGTTGNLSIGNQGTTAITFSNANTVTGTNNLIISNTSTGGLTLASVANIGTVTNGGSGAGVTTISALGAGVTALNQIGTSPLTLTPAWLVTQLGSTVTNGGAGLFTLTGGISGGTNLVFNPNGAGGITVGSTNNTGTITSSGTGTGTVTLSTISAGVTSLNLTSTSGLTLTPAWLVTQFGNTVTNNGAGLLTLTGGITGGTNLVFNATSTGGITVTAAMTTTGTITSSGLGTGNVTLTAAIPTTVTDVVQNSPGTLTLTSGTNAYTGNTIISSGTLSFASTPAVTTSSGLGNSTSNIILGSATTSGTLVYTGASATLSRNFTINAGGGEIDSTAGTLTINPGGVLTAGTLTINPGGPLTFGGANNITLGGATATVALISGTNTLTKVGTGTLTLSTLGGTAAIQSAMPININAGTLTVLTTAVATVNPLGTGAISITPGATLSFSNAGQTFTLPNNITIANAVGTAVLTVSGTVNANGTFTFAPGVNTPTLQFKNTSTSAFITNAAGAISGTGNVQLDGTASGSTVNVSGPQNEIGTITNIGLAGAPVSTLSGTIGSGISAISQAGGNSFTVSSAVPLSATLNSFTSTGVGLWTFSGGITGAQPLTFNANANGNITVSTAAINNAGTITNSGTGGGVTTISANIGSNVTNVVQSGANTQLVLSGTNTYTGTTSVTDGILDFTTTLAIPGYSTSPATAFGKITVASGATLVLPYGGPNSVTATDITNLFNGTYNVFASGSSFGLDTTNASPTTAVLTSVLSDPGGSIGVLNFTKSGTNALTMGSANTYSGFTAIANGTLNVSILNSVNGGTPAFAASSLGAPTTVANGTISLGFGNTTGILSYTGTGETTDRVINLAGTIGGGGLDQSGSGAVHFTGNMTFTGFGAKTLTLSGSTAADGFYDGTIAGNISTGPSPLTIAKTGTGTWHLTGTGNTATTLTISGGVLDTGPNGLTLSDVGAATIQGNGTSGNSASIIGKIILAGVGSSANGADVGATVAGFTLNINAIITGGPTNNLDFFSAGTTVVTGANTYQGQTQISGTTLVISTINNAAGTTFPGGSNLGIPSGTSVKGNPNSTLELASGVLKYVGTGETTDRILDLVGTTTATTIDQSGTGLLKFTGANTATGAGIKTMTLQGSTTGTGEIAGVIAQNSTTNTTSITKAGSGTWTLSGANTYTGATTVNGGNLILSQGTGTGTSSNTSIVINNGGTLSTLAGASGYTVGNTATAAAGGKVTLNTGGTLNMAEGVVNPFILVQNSTFTGNAATFAGGTLNFDIGTTTADQIDVRLNGVSGTGQATSSGANAISINPTTGTLTPGNYTLINAGAVGSTLNNANFYLTSPNLNVGGTLYLLTLSGTTGSEVLTVAVNSGAALTPSGAFWNGTTNGSWAFQPGGNGTATNWSPSANGTADTFALPGSTTNVTFTTNGATILSTTLDQNFTINSLTFSGGGTANSAGGAIAPGSGTNTLTINAAALSGNTAGNGITVIAGAGADLISANVILGASQTWTNNSTNPLTVSGVLSDGGSNFNLTIAGSGTIVLSNAANTYGGVTTISSGSTLSITMLANGGLPSSIGQSSNAAANLIISGTLLFNGSSSTSDRNFTINAGTTAIIDVAGSGSLSMVGATGAVTTGALTKTDSGTLTLTGAQTYTGNTLVNNGTLNISGTGSLTGLAASSKLNINPTAGNTAVVNYTSSGTSTLFAVTGATVVGTASAYNQTNGVVNITPGTGTGTQNVVGATSAYGYYNITGGTFKDANRFTLSNVGTASATNGTGTGVQTGVVFVGGTGTIDQTSAEWYLSYSLGETTVADSGKIDRTGTASTTPYGIIMNTTIVGGSYGVLNIAGSGAQVLLGTGGLRFGNSTTAGNGDGNSGFVNLAAGTFSTGIITAVSLPSAPTATNNGYFNYAGGTLKASAALASGWTPATNSAITFTHTIYGAINNSAVAGAPSFNGGLTVDTNTFAVAIPATMPLLGATGFQVTQSDLTVSGGSGYIGAPAVIFSKPASASGVPAAGYALISGGSVVGIVITDPGVYASGETPTITLVGGGATVAATVTSGALATANSNTGGLTKLNTGTLTIIGTANTFGGAVDIKGGLLTVTTIATGGVASTLGQSSNAASNLLLDGGFLGYSGIVAGVTDRSFTLSVSNSGLDASGTTAGTFTFSNASTMAVTPGLGSANLILQGTGTGTAGAGSLGTLLADGTGTIVSLIKNGTGTWILANNANTYSGSTTINGGILSISAVAPGGSPSQLGASSNAAANLVFNGGTLLFNGSGSATDRNYTFGNATTASGGTIDSEGTGALAITGSMTGINTAAGTQVLNLIAAAGTGNNTIDGVADSNTGSGALTGVTKTGAGTWVIGGSSSYTGATTLTTGTLQFAGSNALQGATAISIAPGTILQIRDNAATITHTANNITVAAAGTVTIDVGNNGGATTGSTVAFGALNNGTAANNLNTTFNFTGSNGYLQSYSSFALPGANGTNTTLVPTTTSVTITGNVTNQITSATGHFDTMFLDGTSAGNAINGTISNSAVYVSVGNGDTRITKQNTSTWTLNGANTYTGPTAVNGGTLALSSTGTLGNTAISVAANAIFAPTPGSGFTSAGSTGAGALGATLNVAAGGIVSMVDGAIGTFNLNQQSSFATAGLTLAGANLNLELSSAGADQIIVSGGAVSSAISGTNTINITALGSSLSPNTTYSILSAPGIAVGNTLFKFSNGTSSESLTVGALTYSLSLTSVAGIEQLVVGNGVVVGNLTWTGQTNGNGAANSVWTATPGGNNNFATSAPAAADYSDGSNVTFQDTNPITAASVTNSTVTIDAAGVKPAAVTVNNTAVNYTFQNASGSIGIAGSTGLTKSGSGTLTLLGQNTYTGVTALNGGLVIVGVAENAGVAGPFGIGGVNGIISFGGGTLQYTAVNQFDYSSRFSTAAGNLISIDTNGQNVIFGTALTSPGGTLTKLGAGKLTLNGVNTFTGNTTVNGGTLTVTGANGSSGALGSPTITVNAGALLDLTNADTLGFLAGRNALVINGGTVQNNATGKRDTLINTVTMTGGFLAGTSLGDGNSGAFSLDNATNAVIATSDAAGNPATISANVSTQAVAIFQVNRGTGAVAAGAPDLVISGPITPYGAAGTNGVTYKGSGIVNITGANTYKGNTTILNGASGGVLNANSIQALGNNTAGVIMGDNTGNFGTLNVNQNNSVTTLMVNTSSTAANTNVNTISIASGKTLTNTGLVTIGLGSTTTTNFTSLTVTGDTWRIGGVGAPTNANVQLGVNGVTNFSNGVTLDLTGLATFFANLGTGTFFVGEQVNAGGTGTAGTTLKLAPVSTILATTISSDSPDGTVTQAIKLGTTTNVLQANTINIGGSLNRAVGTLDFLTGTGTIQIRNLAGTGAAAMNVVSGATASGFAPIGTVDFTGHNSDLQLSTLTVAGRSAGVGAATGTFKFDTGTLSATTVTVATRTGTAQTSANVTGELDLMQTGGTGAATITTLNQGINSVTTATTSGAAVATVNIGGSGTVGITTWNMGNDSVTPGATGQVTGGPLQVTANISGSTTTVGTLTMNVNSSSATGTNKTSVATLNISGGTVNVGAGGISMANASNASAAATSTINVTGNGNLTSSGDITRAGGVGIETTNLNLNGANSVIDMSGGGSVHNIGSSTATIGNFTFTNGTLRNIGTVFGGITLAGTGERVFNETGSFSGQVNGVITGSGVGIDKTGTGTITLLGANTFSGNIDIDGGTLVANLSNNTVNPTSSALGNVQVARNINVNNGGTLQFSSSDTLGGSTSAVAATLVINAGGTVTNDVTGWFNTLGPVQLNGGTLTGVQGASAQSQMYSLQGSVTVGGTSASTISGPAAGGTTFGGYHLAANTAFNVADATGDASPDLDVSGVLIDRPNSLGAGGLTKTGIGNMTLAAVNSYSGTTTVNGGTLQVGLGGVGTTGSGATTVNNSGTLAGSGTVGGTAAITNHSIANGGTLAPGDSSGTAVGTLTFSGNLDLAAGSTTNLQITTASTHDLIVVNGNLSLHSGSTINLLGPSYATTAQAGDVFDLLDWTTIAANGFLVGTNLRNGGTGGGDLNLQNLTNPLLAYDVSNFLNDGSITIVAVPEPGRVLLLCAGLLALGLRRRRREQRLAKS